MNRRADMFSTFLCGFTVVGVIMFLDDFCSVKLEGDASADGGFESFPETKINQPAFKYLAVRLEGRLIQAPSALLPLAHSSLTVRRVIHSSRGNVFLALICIFHTLLISRCPLLSGKQAFALQQAFVSYNINAVGRLLGGKFSRSSQQASFITGNISATCTHKRKDVYQSAWFLTLPLPTLPLNERAGNQSSLGKFLCTFECRCGSTQSGN